MTAGVLGAAGVLVSLLAIWLNYRTARRQKHADSPVFAFARKLRSDSIVIRNHGATVARDVSVRTEHGGFVKWANQYNQALRKPTKTGGHVDGEEPWTSNCDGETRNLAPGESAEIVTAEGMAPGEVLVVTYKNYMGETVKQRQPLESVSSI